MKKNLKSPYIYYSSLFLLIIIGVLFRIEYYNDGIWGDEWISYFFSNPEIPIDQNYKNFLTFEGSPIINLYFNIFWNYLFGFNYQSIELGSLILGFFLLIFSVYFFEENRFKNFFFLFLIISNPFLIYYSGEARFYSASAFFTLISLIFFFELLKNKTYKNIIFFITFSFIAASINIFSISVYISIFIFCFFKKKYNFLIYLTIIGIIFIIFNFEYLITIGKLYIGNGGGSPLNIKFFVGLYFNIFFGNKIFGALFLLIVYYYFFYLNKKLLNKENEKIFLFFLIIFVTYFIPIFYGLIKSPVSSPRHFIFIVPLIIYVASDCIFQIKNVWFKGTLLLTIVFFSIFSNLSDNKPFILSKENPEWVIKHLDKSQIKNIYLEITDAEKISRNIFYNKKQRNIDNYFNHSNIWYFYNQTTFLHSKFFNIPRFNFINSTSNINKFWTLCNNDLSEGIKENPERCTKNKFETTHNLLKIINKDHFTLKLHGIK